jgi:hypothetical protein
MGIELSCTRIYCRFRSLHHLVSDAHHTCHLTDKYAAASRVTLIRLFNSLKPKFILIKYKNSDRTAKKTQLFTITKIKWLTRFKEIITVYSENHKKHINTKEELLIIKVAGTYSYHEALNG